MAYVVINYCHAGAEHRSALNVAAISDARMAGMNSTDSTLKMVSETQTHSPCICQLECSGLCPDHM